LLWETYKTHKYGHKHLLDVKTGGTYSYHWVLNSEFIVLVILIMYIDELKVYVISY
jgi:hypothetical protein